MLLFFIFFCIPFFFIIIYSDSVTLSKFVVNGSKTGAIRAKSCEHLSIVTVFIYQEHDNGDFITPFYFNSCSDIKVGLSNGLNVPVPNVYYCCYYYFIIYFSLYCLIF